eukprot:EG_transcript_6221
MVALLTWFADEIFFCGRPADPPLFVLGDISATLCLFVQNLTNLIVIFQLCQQIIGIPLDVVKGSIIPATAASICCGNVFFWWQGRRLARQENRHDVCAQPFGVNTPDVFSFVFNIMAVVAVASGHRDAYLAGLLANLMSAMVTIAVIPVGRWLDRRLPRVALFSALAGIALAYLALGPLVRMYATAFVGLLPTLVLVLLLLARVQTVFSCPVIILQWTLSIILGWATRAFDSSIANQFVPLSLVVWWDHYSGLYLPIFALVDWWDAFGIGMKYSSVWLPLAVVAVAEVIINVSLARNIGRDDFSLPETLGVNALTCILGTALGSPFPTVTYIGHPSFKEVGGRTGYSLLHGILIFGFAVTGGFTLLLTLMPEQAFFPMVVFIGLDIVAETGRHLEPRHFPALAVGLLPALANFVWGLLSSALEVVHRDAKDGRGLAYWLAQGGLAGSPVFVAGLIRLSQGFVLSGMLLSAAVAFLIDDNYFQVCMTFLALATLAAIGLIHSFAVQPGSGIVNSVFLWECGCVNAAEEAGAYAALALGFAGAELFRRCHRRGLEGHALQAPDSPDEPVDLCPGDAWHGAVAPNVFCLAKSHPKICSKWPKFVVQL